MKDNTIDLKSIGEALERYGRVVGKALSTIQERLESHHKKLRERNKHD